MLKKRSSFLPVSVARNIDRIDVLRCRIVMRHEVRANRVVEEVLRIRARELNASPVLLAAIWIRTFHERDIGSFRHRRFRAENCPVGAIRNRYERAE